MAIDTKEEISRPYYSNCLLEATKAKIRNPEIEIITRPIPDTKIHHFLWIDGDYLYDFGVEERICTPLLLKAASEDGQNTLILKNFRRPRVSRNESKKCCGIVSGKEQNDG